MLLLQSKLNVANIISGRLSEDDIPEYDPRKVLFSEHQDTCEKRMLNFRTVQH